MFLHIALTIIDPVEIENFCKEVLQLTIRRKFSISSEILQNIFHAAEAVEIYFIRDKNENIFKIKDMQVAN